MIINKKMLKNSSILITGGTGSFGHSFVPLTLKKYNPRRLVIFSRDEMKQWEMVKTGLKVMIEFVFLLEIYVIKIVYTELCMEFEFCCARGSK